MEGTELEEGEACSYQYDEETNIDLDALTYIVRASLLVFVKASIFINLSVIFA